MQIITVWFQLIGRTLAALWRWACHEPLAAGVLFLTMPALGLVRAFTASRVGGPVLDVAWLVLAGCWVWAGATNPPQPLHLLPWLRHDIARLRQAIGQTTTSASPVTPFPTAAGTPPAPARPGAATLGFTPGAAPYTPRALDLDAISAKLKSHILGQDHVIDVLTDAMRRRAAGLSGDRLRPLSALFAGPTGSGKTELAKAFAHLTGRDLIRYDMSNFHDRHSAAAFVGAPPGYVSSDRPGRLVSDIAAHPQAVVLFDELEKADRLVLDPLLRLVDEGWAVELSQGLRADGRDCVLMFTSNLLQTEAVHEWTDDPSRIRQMLVHSGALRSEFVNRVEIVALFRPFDDAQLANVVRKLTADYLTAWARREGLQVQVQIEEPVIGLIAARCDKAFGARDAQRRIADVLGDKLTREYLRLKQQHRKPTRLRVALGQDDEIALEIE
jgi:hypothetical protein